MDFKDLKLCISHCFQSRILIKNFESGELLDYHKCIQNELEKRGFRPFATFVLSKKMKEMLLRNEEENLNDLNKHE